MGLPSQILLLLRKELITIWRSKIWFIAEFMLGFLVLLAVHLVITSSEDDSKSESYSFEPVPITGDVEDLFREVKTISSIYKKTCMKYEDRVLAYVSDNDVGQRIMLNLEENYNHTFEARQFLSLNDMETALKKDLNDTMYCGRFIGGVYFQNVSLTPPKLIYSILMPSRSGEDWEVSEFWPEDGPYSAMPDINSIPNPPPYWSNGFLSFQFSIERNFLKMLDKEIDFDVFLHRMPMPESRIGGAATFLKVTPMVWSMVLLVTMLHTAKNIMDEKDVGIKTYMMVMGMDSMAFYGSHFLVGLFKMCIIMFANAGYLSLGLMNVSSSLFVMFSLVYGLSAILFAVLITTLIRKPSAGLTCLVVGWIALLILNMAVKPSMNDVGMSMLASLNYFTAFKLGIGAASNYEIRMEDLGWLNMFSGSTTSFTFGLAFLMLLFDCVLMVALIYYLDSVVPTDESPRKHPLFFLRFLSPSLAMDRSMEVGQDETDAKSPDSAHEGERGLNQDEADIDIQRMSKVWESTGVMAVDNLSFRAYRGQVTVLLGHNGAGKSTTFSALCGATTISSGHVWICQQSVTENLHDCQRQIGYCPQYNPLFAKLTVREHLRLYAKLKQSTGRKGQEGDLERDIEALTAQVQLGNKLDVQAHELSGGMKRKLCVAMSLIGDSRVVLLDEPTAGMDPEARHDVALLLKNAKRNRTVLLTTHYMDEADLLGDRVVIMVKGRVACNGSPEFLKNKFGTGYVLSVVVNDERRSRGVSFNTYINTILQVIRKHAHDARVDKAGDPEFSIVLPVQYKKFFGNLFEELEQRGQELLGELSCDTDAECAPDETDSSRVTQVAADLFRPLSNGASLLEQACHPLTLVCKLWSIQLFALINRHILNAWRNKIRTFLPIVLSLLFFVLFGMTVRYLKGAKQMDRDLSLTSLEPVTFPLLVQNSSHMIANFTRILAQLTNGTRNNLQTFPSSIDLQSALLDKAYVSPPLGLGAAVLHNASQNASVHALFNGAAHHSPPAALLLISNALLKRDPDTIRLSLRIYGDSIEDDIIRAVVDVTATAIVALIVIVAFSSLTSTFVMPLVDDRQRRFKHQMLLTKLNVFVYWLSVLVWNLILYSLFCLLLTAIIMTFGWVHNCLGAYFILWAAYFWCSVPFVYCTSFLFDSSIRAYTALLCWMAVSMVVVVIITVLHAIFSGQVSDIFSKIALVVLPSYSLANGIIMVTPQCMLADTELLGPFNVWEALRSTIWPMLGSGVVFWATLCLLQSKRVALFLHQTTCMLKRKAYLMIRADSEPLDDKDVARERSVMRNVDDSEYALAVRELYKYYGNLSAVKNLTFGVRHSDCFGLLGVNGAGKTTTFDILTGLSFPSSGQAMINGEDVLNSPPIGYCPQFDALPLDLTGRETLWLLAKLNGFKDASDRVEKVLWAIHMTEHGDKLVQYYSGGQKRRLSIGITLMSRAGLIMLDEPTAGIDPTARRHIWQLLGAVRQQKVAILLTSHSMEECEVLCNRIGFMNKGSMVGIGTSQHLKSRFGNSFLLSYTIDNPNPATCQFLDNLVVTEFNALPTQDAPTMCTQHWEIPKGPNSRWGWLFQKAQSIADNYPARAYGLPPGSELPLIKDFSLTQNSLEQVFLRMAHMDEIGEREDSEGS
ncbi:ABC transporter domain-containing protein [Ditylenchus destructor]|uniref:ABC transporter domain-containing protein n=1 Tax=Ditylenchus destructor TaxID=166010 RepID=A0AAD4NG33_9BILA|nr:ABC transporter domain-containing protein [Ditylenchus destructor]